MNIVKPLYKESIVNVMASIYKCYGGKPDYESLSELDEVLNKKYKHIMLLVFDGFGFKAMENHLSETSFMRINNLKSIQSVFPPTTTAAMTSYYTGVSPNEHGWLGWSLYFKEYGCAIDLFTNRNSYSGQPMNQERIAYKALPYKTIYKKIDELNKGIRIHTVKPSAIYFPSDPNVHHGIETLAEMMDLLVEINNGNESTFTSCYWPDPDMTIHNSGPDEISVKNVFDEINDYILKLSSELHDTLLIVSADHGLTAIKEEIYLNEYEDLVDCLLMPPAIEGRAMSFWVKPDKKRVFEMLFREFFDKDFKLYTKEEILNENLFGLFETHKRVDDFVGDFLACAIGSKLIYYKTIGGNEPHHFKGHHAGLTDEEMLIPLIVKECI